MKITVAGNKKEYEDGITVAELIVKENVENPEYVTVTVNDDFVERDDFEIDDTVDITDVVCPTTFVKAKVALEELDDGQILAVRMNDGEPVQNVPRSIKEEGHQILKLTANEDGTYTLIVRKVEDED